MGKASWERREMYSWKEGSRVFVRASAERWNGASERALMFKNRAMEVRNKDERLLLPDKQI